MPRHDRPLGEKRAQASERLGDDAKVRPPTPLLTLEETRLCEDLQVVTHGRLAQPQRLCEVAHARFSSRLRLDQAEQPEARGIGKDAECSCDVLGVAGIEWRL